MDLVDQETTFHKKIEEVVRFVHLQVFVCVPQGRNAISINEWLLKNLSRRNCCIYKIAKNILGIEKGYLGWNLGKLINGIARLKRLDLLIERQRGVVLTAFSNCK